MQAQAMIVLTETIASLYEAGHVDCPFSAVIMPVDRQSGAPQGGCPGNVHSRYTDLFTLSLADDPRVQWFPLLYPH